MKIKMNYVMLVISDFVKNIKNEQKIHQKIYMPWLTDIIFPSANVNKL
jgi:hypothetical protein